jgi:signal transduction histidine kinase
LAAIADSVAAQNSGPAADKGIDLRSTASSRPAVAPADTEAIRRVLLILVDNALQHTPHGGMVTVSVGTSPHAVQLSVEDTGDGIAPDALPHIFERFYRADSARSNGGFGLGLSIAQAVVQAHGAEIHAESQLGKGSRFWFELKS